MRAVTDAVTTALTLLESNNVTTYFVSYGATGIVEMFITDNTENAASLLGLKNVSKGLAVGSFKDTHFTIYGSYK